MYTKIHPQARSVFAELPILGPLKTYFFPAHVDIDLTNNTNAFMDDFAQYPDPMQFSLKKQYWNVISKLNLPKSESQQAKIERENDIDISDHILFTVGSSEGIDLLLRTFAEPNKDTIVVTSPSFPAYEHWGRIHNLKIKSVPLEGENYDSFSVKDIVEVNPKLVFLCNPNNPTGTVLKQNLIHELCQCPDFKGFVVVDEAYIEFSDEPSMIHELEHYKNLIILRTLSKAWGLAGIRCGAVIADPGVIFTLRYIQVPFGFPVPSQDIVRERCLHPQSMYASWEIIISERDNMIKELRKLESVERVIDSHTNFLLIILKNHSEIMNLLKRHNIYVMDCSSVIDRAIRITVVTEAENSQFLGAMKFLMKPGISHSALD